MMFTPLPAAGEATLPGVRMFPNDPLGRLLLDTPRPPLSDEPYRVRDAYSGHAFTAVAADCGLGCRCAAEVTHAADCPCEYPSSNVHVVTGAGASESCCRPPKRARKARHRGSDGTAATA